MTPIQLNAEIYRAMSVIAEDEALLKRAVRHLKKLAAQKQEEDSLMTKEEFLARVDEAKQEIAGRKGRSFTNIEELDRHIRSLCNTMSSLLPKLKKT